MNVYNRKYVKSIKIISSVLRSNGPESLAWQLLCMAPPAYSSCDTNITGPDRIAAVEDACSGGIEQGSNATYHPCCH